MTEHTDNAWFMPKRYGLGSGLPIRWQRWLLLAAHVALVAAASAFDNTAPMTFSVWAIAITASAMPIYAAWTRGGWRWRWGGD